MISRLRGRGLRRRAELSLRYGLRPDSAVRILRNRHLRRAMPGFVGEVRRAVVRDVVAAAAGLVLLRRRPRLGAAFAAAWVVAVGLAERSSRIGVGPRGDLPPGKLTDCPEFAMNRAFHAEAARRHGPVFSTSEGPGVHQVCVVGLDRGRRLLARHRESLAPPVWSMDRLVPGDLVRHQQGDLHRRYRAALSTGLDETALSDLAAISQETGAAIAARLRSADAPATAVEEEVIGSFQRLFFGLERKGSRIDEVIALFEELQLGLDAAPTPREEAVIDALERLVVVPLRDDAPAVHGTVIGVLAAAGLDPIGDGTLRRNLVVMSRTTALDTSGLLVWVVWFLAQNPEALVGADGPLDRDRIDAIVSETLRLAQSEYIRRVCVGEDVEVEGRRIPRDAIVRILVGESHRDPGVFERPLEFDPDRFMGRRVGPNEFAPFGLDGHACVGEHIVRAMAAGLVEELAVAGGLRVVDDGPAELNRWQHWAPSSSFRVTVGSSPSIP